MARVLVTGANGFLGAEVVRTLRQRNHEVTVLLRPGRELPAGWDERVQVIRGDISRRQDVLIAAEGVSWIHHIAAVVGDWSPWSEHETVTLGGTRNALEAARRHHCPVILASSVTVYGHHLGTGACDEHTPHGRPMGNYSRAKQAQEDLCRDYSRQYGVDSIIIRPANIYGPGSGPWLHDLGDQLRAGMPAQVGSPENNAGLVHVANVAELFALAQEGAATGWTFNACDGLNVTWQKYLSDIARLIEAPAPRHLPWLVGLLGAWTMEGLWRLVRARNRPPITREAFNIVGSDNRFPADRARKRLGWRPTVSYEQGLEGIAEYVRAGHMDP